MNSPTIVSTINSQNAPISMKLKASFEVRQTGMPHTYFGPSAWASKKTSNVTLTYVLVLILPKFPYLGLTCTTPFQSLRVLAKSSWRESSASSDSVKCFKFLFTIQIGESFHIWLGNFKMIPMILAKIRPLTLWLCNFFTRVYM